MKLLTPEERTAVVFYTTKVVAVVGVVLVFGFVAAQAYVRWSINQNFTFLGGFELEALTISTFALLVALAIRER